MMHVATVVMRLMLVLCLSLDYLGIANVHAHDLRGNVAKIRPAVVGIGTHLTTRSPASQLMGTGFVVGDGTFIATNSHVVPEKLNEERLEKVVVFVGRGTKPKVFPATLVERDRHHDLALLKVKQKILPAGLTLGESDEVSEGTSIMFTGFPIGAILGLYPASHHGIVSAITPVATPANSADGLSAQRIRMLRDRYDVFQLDATASPGNSGSPVIEVENNKVIGIVNQVFVKKSRENVLSDPSAITYAIPSKYLKIMLKKAGQ